MTAAGSPPEDVAAFAKSKGGELGRGVTTAIGFYHYERGRLSAGKAAQLLGIARDEFEQMRIARGIDRPFSSEELERDLAWSHRKP